MPRFSCSRVIVLAATFLLLLVLGRRIWTPVQQRGQSSPPGHSNHRDPPTSSWHRCVHARDPGRRSCHFRNVCLRLLPPTTLKDQRLATPRNSTPIVVGKILYYRDPDTSHVPLDALLSMTLQPLRVRSWEPQFPEPLAIPEIIQSSIPSSAVFREGVVAWMGSYWPTNFGHAIGDDFFPIFRLLRRFGFLGRSRDTRILMHPDCTMGGLGPPAGCENHKALSDLMGFGGLLDMKSLLTSETPLCVRDLLVGGDSYGLKHAGDALWDEYSTFMLGVNGHDRLGRLREQRVVLVDKKGRRRMKNIQAIENRIKNTFDVTTTILDVTKLSLREQMEEMTSTSVLVAPCGAVSFINTFLPAGAAMVIPCFLDMDVGQPRQMDELIWTTSAHVADFYYPLEENEVSLNEESAAPQRFDDDHKNETFMLYRDFADIVISDYGKLDLLLSQALLHAEASFGFTLPSFKRVPKQSGPHPSLRFEKMAMCQKKLESLRPLLPERVLAESDWMGRSLRYHAESLMNSTELKRALESIPKECK